MLWPQGVQHKMTNLMCGVKVFQNLEELLWHRSEVVILIGFFFLTWWCRNFLGVKRLSNALGYNWIQDLDQRQSLDQDFALMWIALQLHYGNLLGRLFCISQYQHSPLYTLFPITSMSEEVLLAAQRVRRIQHAGTVCFNSSFTEHSVCLYISIMSVLANRLFTLISVIWKWYISLTLLKCLWRMKYQCSVKT